MPELLLPEDAADFPLLLPLLIPLEDSEDRFVSSGAITTAPLSSTSKNKATLCSPQPRFLVNASKAASAALEGLKDVERKIHRCRSEVCSGLVLSFCTTQIVSAPFNGAAYAELFSL